MLAFVHYLEHQKTLKLLTLKILKIFERQEREREGGGSPGSLNQS